MMIESLSDLLNSVDNIDLRVSLGDIFVPAARGLAPEFESKVIGDDFVDEAVAGEWSEFLMDVGDLSELSTG